MKPDLKPHNINKETWYYETKQGLEFVRQVWNKEKTQLIETSIFKVPFRKMEKSFLKWIKSNRKK